MHQQPCKRLHTTATANGMSASTASNCTIKGTSKGNLPISCLSPTATECHRIPTIQAPSFSIGQVCDDNCIAVFTNQAVTISKVSDINVTCMKEPTITGCQATNKLWNIPAPKQPTHMANSACTQVNANELAAFLHATAGHPALQAFCKAIDAGWFITWPGLSSPLIHKHLKQSIPTIMGKIQRA